jgi:predicted CoA-binding protein
MADSTRDEVIVETLRNANTIAVVGASPKPHRASHRVMQFLQSKGYRCIPVNPAHAGKTLLGETVYPDLASIPVKVDFVDVFRNPLAAGPVVDEAIAVGANTVWMQLGVINEPAAERGRNAGLTVIMDRCPAIEWGRLGMRVLDRERPPARGA